jgi:hypothetical protein
MLNSSTAVREVEVPGVQAKSGQRAKSAGGEAFDIHVVAFVGAPARSLQGLQRIFGMDATAAQRILDAVPSVLRRAAPADEAQGYREALESIGAQVVLQRVAREETAPAPGRRPAPPPTPPAALRAGGPPPPPAASMGRAEPLPAPRNLMDLSEPPLPRPVLRARPPSEDLEYDMLAGADAAQSSDPLMGFGEAQSALDAAQPDEPHAAGDATRAGLRTVRREELDLDSGDSGGALDLALPSPAPRRAAPAAQRPEPLSHDADTAALESEAARAPTETQAARTQRTANSKPEAGAAQRGPLMSRAALVEKPAVTQSQSPKSLPLLQLLAAVLVVSLGLWFDSSILYGNASTFSVVVHGLAIQQFALGVWGLFR